MKCYTPFLLLSLVIAGCSGSSGNVNLNIDKDTGEDFSTPKSEVIVPVEVVEDTAVPEEIASLPEVTADVGITPQCDPGEGCFLDKCADNEDCDSGWCVQHMGEGVCSIACQAECPSGWSCKQVTGAGPNLTYVCVSNHANLCRPCADNGDCTGPTGTEDACIAYGEDGNFCGSACDEEAGEGGECPWGFSCSDVLTVDGVELKQCANDAGVCPCTDAAVALGLWTPCEVANETGTCQGKRVCLESGLSDCDAFVPAAESCNGKDDDCDGEVDEPTLEDGVYLPVCDDGNECTTDSCNGEEGCEYVSLSEGECKDGDACTVGDHCDAGECVGSPAVCDDGNECTDDSCDGLGGCSFTPNSQDCNDDDPCTVADQCKDEVCQGFPIPCDCMTDVDCAELEDGDACTGTLICDSGEWPYECVVKPGTAVICPSAEGPDAICLQPTCDAETGDCGYAPAHEGFACDDGDACTVGDKCEEGVCTAGVPLTCNDDNLCTDDSCTPESGCTYTPNASACSDGNVCTSGDECAGGFCLSGDTVNCDDGNTCNGEEGCDPEMGCTVGEPLSCGDDDLCNGVEWCDPLLGCQPGAVPLCDDDNPCTEDQCNPVTGACAHPPVDSVCDDGNICTSGDQCDQGECIPGQMDDCDDGNVCTTDSCHPTNGCTYSLNSAPCDDGDVCSTGDKCHLGDCISAGELMCDDNNTCTDDSCNPATGCEFLPNNAPCDDGDDCTEDDKCSGGWCKSGVNLACDDNNPCTDDLCAPGAGCSHVNNFSPCDDGIPCTENDSCAAGICTPGAPLDCADELFCNGVEVCDLQLGCVPGEPLDLDDGVDCTLDGCDENNDIIVHTPSDPACDDDQFCNGAETCHLTEGCQDGEPPSVDDEVSCTIDSCDEDNDIAVHVPDDALCSDGKECTADSCDPELNCQHVEIGDCGGPHYKLVGVPTPSTVFNDIEKTYFYPNNLVNGIWHGPSNLIIVGHAYGNGYWSYPAGTNQYTTTPNKGSGDYDRMVHMPQTGVMIHTENQYNAQAASGIWIGMADFDTGELSTFQKAQWSDNFSGTCNLMSASPDQFMCYTGATIRHYNTATDSPVLSYSHTTNLSPPPTDPCTSGCFQGTFAWDGMYYYFTVDGDTLNNKGFDVYKEDGTKLGTYTVSGGGAISGTYFDWSVGRYATHDGYGNRKGGNLYWPTNGGQGDDSQSYSPPSPWHSL